MARRQLAGTGQRGRRGAVEHRREVCLLQFGDRPLGRSVRTRDLGANDELKQEASRAFRKLSGDLIGKRRVILHYRIFERLELLPSKGGIAEVAKNLVFLSNSVGCDEYAHFDNAAERIKAVLWLDV